MTLGKDRKRRGGHPAKQAARRERERVRREGPPDPLRRAAASACREAAALGSALEAELWASRLLGSWWPPRLELRGADRDADLEIGGPLIAEMARVGGEGAVAALIALGELSEGPLGPKARELAEQLRATGGKRPSWEEAIDEAEILRVAVMREPIFDDGLTLFIEARHLDGEPHAIGVYIDHNLGGMAKDILMADSLADVERVLASDPDALAAPVLEPIGTGEAWVRIDAAMELTDRTLDPPVGEDYASLRAIALLRAAELPGPFPEINEPELTQAERDELRAHFLTSPEAAGFAADGDEAFIASLVIDYCADYVDGRPLRWSPVTVELFMVDWLPRKVMADRATFDVVPRALTAWVRYAGRRRELPDWAVAETTSAIERWAPEMLALLDDDHPGSGMELLSAAKDAGVDLTDETALATFIAGWNAHSDRP